jgi:hypothetical protein
MFAIIHHNRMWINIISARASNEYCFDAGYVNAIISSYPGIPGTAIV